MSRKERKEISAVRLKDKLRKKNIIQLFENFANHRTERFYWWKKVYDDEISFFFFFHFLDGE